MRPIKFRGETFCGEFIFGDVVHYDDGEVAITNGFENRFVKPTSVAQFVGYDVDGQEVYEGDELKAGRYGEDGRAEIFCSIDAYDFRFGARFDNYKLKK